ncbi:glycosyltransferase [Lachnoclostridium sp. An169]|uniref:glycosyltransferase family 2 protein n=1 Tax=Lachnoclostridium sp. An169 TaxID=1965569 RepID=UPI000B37976E|nr:glycosyltransferase family 2 protein [Lachnoclostridium sp. An169]OUP86533.1 glycosyltransferase [Lachnoclostridium sp. An169]HJA65285.1 glycosyltransferase family 2 protein [Candidatus Mediterraneibacter cottocaccae]
MIVSVCVIAYNEEEYLGNILENIKEQTFPHDQMEIVLVDSMSKDGTKAIMEKFQKEEKDFKSVIVLDNPGRRLPAGWNVALKNYTGDIILRVDAHSMIPKDFVAKNVAVLESGEYVSGGIRPNIIQGSTPWKETLLMAEQSMFGSSIASYRRSGKKGYVKTLFHGAYRREVFEKAGEFNEKLGRTEDNEMNYRIRKAGYKLCYSPEIISYQYTRSSLKAMLKQKFGNGYWVALTLKVCPGCLSLYHFIPAAFVFGILITTLLGILGYPQFAAVMWGLYWLMAIIMSIQAVIGHRKFWQELLLPILFFLLHISYGIGSFAGLIKLPFWKAK